MRQWCLPSFTLDLSGLWTHPDGPRATGQESLIAENAWTALRRRFDSGRLGFFDLPLTVPQWIASWKAKAGELRASFEGAVLIGIGGSYWGAQAIMQAIGSVKNDEFPLLWVTQPDPDRMDTVVKVCRQRRMAAVVISKSGNTTETLSAFYHLSALLEPKGIVVITDPNEGELRALARESGWTTFDVPPNVGGRFSVLSAAGLFPSLLAGVPAEELLSGARRVRDYLESSHPQECPAFWMAYSHFRWQQVNRNIHYLMPYRQSLSAFISWYVQLWAESLGKKTEDGRHVGFTPVGALGPSDQHSVLQLFKEGPRDKIIGFIDVMPHSRTPVGSPKFAPRTPYLAECTFEEIIHASCIATETTLKNSQVPCYHLIVENVRAETLGALFLFFETSCALAGELYGIDAFGQPGVEEGKKLLKDLLQSGTARRHSSAGPRPLI